MSENEASIINQNSITIICIKQLYNTHTNWHRIVS